MLSRHFAASILGVFLIAAFAPANAQEKRPETRPGSDAKPAPAKAAESQISDIQELLWLMNGGVIVLSEGDEKPASEKKPANAAAAVQKALKQLSGPADQLDLREVRKLLSEALSEMKQKSGGDFRVDVGGIRIDVPPLGPNPMAKSGAQVAPEAMHDQIRREIEKLEQLVQDLGRVGNEAQKRSAEKQLEEARRAFERALTEKVKKPAPAAASVAVPAQFIVRFANEPASENLTLTRRNGRYVVRLIEPGVRITVTGPIPADPKATDAIVIEAGDDVSSYANVAAVPERHRAKVTQLLDLARR